MANSNTIGSAPSRKIRTGVPHILNQPKRQGEISALDVLEAGSAKKGEPSQAPGKGASQTMALAKKTESIGWVAWLMCGGWLNKWMPAAAAEELRLGAVVAGLQFISQIILSVCIIAVLALPRIYAKAADGYRATRNFVTGKSALSSAAHLFVELRARMAVDGRLGTHVHPNDLSPLVEKHGYARDLAVRLAHALNAEKDLPGSAMRFATTARALEVDWLTCNDLTTLYSDRGNLKVAKVFKKAGLLAEALPYYMAAHRPGRELKEDFVSAALAAGDAHALQLVSESKLGSGRADVWLARAAAIENAARRRLPPEDGNRSVRGDHLALGDLEPTARFPVPPAIRRDVLSCFEHAATCAPGDAEVPYRHAVFLARVLGDLPGARAKLAVAAEQGHTGAQHGLGLCDMQQNPRAAHAALARLAEQDPRCLAYQVGLGEACRRLAALDHEASAAAGHRASAEAAFRAAVALDPYSASAHRGLSLVLTDVRERSKSDLRARQLDGSVS